MKEEKVSKREVASSAAKTKSQQTITHLFNEARKYDPKSKESGELNAALAFFSVQRSDSYLYSGEGRFPIFAT